MTEPTGTHPERDLLLPALAAVPVLAFGGTLLGIALHNAGALSEIQYAAAGSLAASCLVAYLAWARADRDIVSLSTPIYGFIFMVTPIDFAGGVALQLVYAAGLTILAARLRPRCGKGSNAGTAIVSGHLAAYLATLAGPFATLGPDDGRLAADAFLRFSAGDYRMAADHARAAAGRDGMPPALVRGFSIVREQADLLDRDAGQPLTFLTFSGEDAPLLARPPEPGSSPEREFEAALDNALLLLYAAAWHSSPADREALVLSQGFAGRLLDTPPG